ncbi:HAMP domain-containing protein [Vibrio phage vB_VpP_HA1]|uniref:HAMP domain-containing protein n=1 Tax=Vibrio phage vB_VpP_HA1 TaxID=2980503 RepID=A0A977Q8H1_9CAUD|nr:HAMP domain-containing protein [Vibrio phage vB_VpP_HA1]
MFKWLKKKCDAVVNKLKTITWSVAFKRFLAVPLLAVFGYDIHVMANSPSFAHFMGISIDLVLMMWWVEWLLDGDKTVIDLDVFNRHWLGRLLLVLLFLIALPAILILAVVTWFILEFIPEVSRDFKLTVREMWDFIKTGNH